MLSLEIRFSLSPKTTFPMISIFNQLFMLTTQLFTPVFIPSLIVSKITQRRVCNVIWHLDFTHFPNDVIRIPTVFSMNISTAVALMRSSPWYLDHMNVTVLLDWLLYVIVLLLKYLDITVRFILIDYFFRPFTSPEHYSYFHGLLPPKIVQNLNFHFYFQEALESQWHCLGLYVIKVKDKQTDKKK